MQPLPREPHSAIICGQTGCGKTQFVLDELLHPEHGYYRNAFEVIFITCPTWKRNRTYLERQWLWRGPDASRFLFIDPGERLHDWLRALFGVAADTPTLYLIDDMTASKALTKRRTCFQSWPSVGATQNSRSGSLSKNTTPYVRTSVSRRSGWHCSTARTGSRSQVRLMRMTLCRTSFAHHFARA